MGVIANLPTECHLSSQKDAASFAPCLSHVTPETQTNMTQYADTALVQAEGHMSDNMELLTAIISFEILAVFTIWIAYSIASSRDNHAERDRLYQKLFKQGYYVPGLNKGDWDARLEFNQRMEFITGKAALAKAKKQHSFKTNSRGVSNT